MMFNYFGGKKNYLRNSPTKYCIKVIDYLRKCETAGICDKSQVNSWRVMLPRFRENEMLKDNEREKCTNEHVLLSRNHKH